MKARSLNVYMNLCYLLVRLYVIAWSQHEDVMDELVKRQVAEIKSVWRKNDDKTS